MMMMMKTWAKRRVDEWQSSTFATLTVAFETLINMIIMISMISMIIMIIMMISMISMITSVCHFAYDFGYE